MQDFAVVWSFQNSEELRRLCSVPRDKLTNSPKSDIDGDLLRNEILNLRQHIEYSRATPIGTTSSKSATFKSYIPTSGYGCVFCQRYRRLSHLRWELARTGFTSLASLSNENQIAEYLHSASLIREFADKKLEK
ncbi:hypothetical protein EVAR_53468_1 [Eumeta japonica]|uniref:Uncharacterized protein n=1 Tax=Eumeta variegata TaxID=151549 RepID=A0A4C1XQ84_EUMVA|nr:hypothetical protein EVAR_53468_1 [Eumeta japonica]